METIDWPPTSQCRATEVNAMKKAGDPYRERARSCRDRAESAASDADREKWLVIANEWERLGDSVDRSHLAGQLEH
jgi:hypothetical protein